MVGLELGWKLGSCLGLSWVGLGWVVLGRAAGKGAQVGGVAWVARVT